MPQQISLPAASFAFSSNKYTLNRNEKQENYNGDRSHKAHFFPRYGENKVVLRL